MSRRLSREEAFKVLFEMSFQSEEALPQILEYYYENLVNEQLEKEYFSNVVNGVCKNIVALDEHIACHSIGWTKNRISKVSMSVLWIALYEILYMDDIPASVSANEAVELAKKYESPESGAFVNGIIGAFIKSLKSPENKGE